jgi:pimeloyl-ACP methyl ester carboxylesterase
MKLLTRVRGLAFLLPFGSIVAIASPDPGTSASAFTVVTPCPFEAAAGLPPERLSCGWLAVPENRERPCSATLRLPVAIIRSAHEQPEPDPVVFIAGGPGASPTTSPHTFKLFAAHAFGADRDVVIYTQRGALTTEPDLRCEALRQPRGAIYLQDHSLEERDRAIAGAAIACLRDLQRQGRDLDGYSARENALDLRDLRVALALPQWNLLAVSYGTLIAVEAARVDPGGVRSLVLDSLVSPESDLFMSEAQRNFRRGLDRVLAACDADAACQERFGDLRSTLDQALAVLKADPPTVTLAGLEGAEVLSMTVNWHDFLGLLHWMLYNAQSLTLAPLLIDETAGGRMGLLTTLLSRVFPGPTLGGEGVAPAFFATVCRDQFSDRGPLPRAAAGYDGFAITSFMEQVCSDPALGYGTNRAATPLASAVPTLLLSGHFDPMTPDLYAEQVARRLPNSTIVRIPDFGHSTLSGYTACQTELAAAFLDDLKDKRGFPCLAGIGPPTFVLSMQEARAHFAEGR